MGNGCPAAAALCPNPRRGSRQRPARPWRGAALLSGAPASSPKDSTLAQTVDITTVSPAQLRRKIPTRRTAYSSGLSAPGGLAAGACGALFARRFRAWSPALAAPADARPRRRGPQRPTRLSASASRPARSTLRNESSARSGCSPITSRAPPAWITITDTLCAITSCSSRAIRARSPYAAARPLASRAASSCSANARPCCSRAARARIIRPRAYGNRTANI